MQQLIKRFGIIIYMGNRLYDIEMMQIELNRFYQAGLLDRMDYMEAELVLRREQRLDFEYQKSR
ncbi:YqgQ family protein [Streptococcus suis]